MPASRLLRLPRMLVDRAYMPPPFGRRPGGIASRVSFSADDPRGNGFDVVLRGDGAVAEERPAPASTPGDRHGSIRRRDRSRTAPLRRPRRRRVARQDARGRRRAALREALLIETCGNVAPE